jgi:hypothetical protein
MSGETLKNTTLKTTLVGLTALALLGVGAGGYAALESQRYEYDDRCLPQATTQVDPNILRMDVRDTWFNKVYSANLIAHTSQAKSLSSVPMDWDVPIGGQNKMPILPTVIKFGASSRHPNSGYDYHIRFRQPLLVKYAEDFMWKIFGITGFSKPRSSEAVIGVSKRSNGTLKVNCRDID